MPPRTTAVFVQGEVTQITIVKDARPDNKRNFHFGGTLAPSPLRISTGPQGGNFSKSKTFSVNPGTYTVRENVAHDWWLLDVACDIAGRAHAHLARPKCASPFTRATASLAPSSTALRRRLARPVYRDSNGNGELNRREEGMEGLAGNVVYKRWAAGWPDKTNDYGKAHFWNLAPGISKVCSEIRAELVGNTSQGSPTLPRVTCSANRRDATPGDKTEAFFGYSNQVPFGRAHIIHLGRPAHAVKSVFDNSDARAAANRSST